MQGAKEYGIYAEGEKHSILRWEELKKEEIPKKKTMRHG